MSYSPFEDSYAEHESIARGQTPDYKYMETSLTPTQRLTGFLALLDDVIKKDEERTEGEWNGRNKVGAWIAGHGFTLPDASHIAIGSISQGRNAKELKYLVEELQILVRVATDKSVIAWAEARIAHAYSLYPDEILKRYLK